MQKSLFLKIIMIAGLLSFASGYSTITNKIHGLDLSKIMIVVSDKTLPAGQPTNVMPQYQQDQIYYQRALLNNDFASIPELQGKKFILITENPVPGGTVRIYYIVD